ncbi:MAG: tetratricopeptide repeat protein [Candidatus Thorarchaeota archaeon]
MTSADKLLMDARAALEEGRRESAARSISLAAKVFASQEEYETAATLYERAGFIYRDIYLAYESYQSFDNATLMLIRQPTSDKIHRKIVDLNSKAGRIAEEATDYKRAADFYFRAADFSANEEEKRDLTIKAADALENLADVREEEQDLESAVSLLKKVGRLYYTSGDDELGRRINERAVKVSMKWAENARAEGDLLCAGNALAEAAQIIQTGGELPEATRLMLDAGELYEAVELFEKAGNIYDAAQEAFKFLRLTSARKNAIMKAAEAYLKMEGVPEVVAPLLVKSGNLFREAGSDMKAKWAFKRGSELFGELAVKARENEEVESEKKFLRYQAMCLFNWGRDDEANEIYQDVVDYYLEQAKSEEKNDNKEAQAVALEAAAEVLDESGRVEEARLHSTTALEIYVGLAEEFSSSQQFDESSRFYSKAAECSMRLGDATSSQTYHKISSESAERAARVYEEMGIPEIATIWLRTAGNEALRTQDDDLVDNAIGLLRSSADGFERMGEMDNTFEDLFAVFEATFTHRPDKREEIGEIMSRMEEIARNAQDFKMESLMAVILSLEKGNPTAALLTLQEREDELLPKRDRLLSLVDQSKRVRAPEDVKSTGRTHWLYK